MKEGNSDLKNCSVAFQKKKAKLKYFPRIRVSIIRFLAPIVQQLITLISTILSGHMQVALPYNFD